MHFYVPPWLRHGRARSPVSIFSVDIEPHGQRLASAGQDCAVKIWSLPVLAALAIPARAENSRDVKPANPALPPDTPPPHALLASISSHSSAVNCVRWAPAGKLLASGGDDAVVLIYEQIPGQPQNSAFAAGGKPALENWTVRRPLRGHTGDVTDVCWSPDGQRLASASVDNAVYIWSVRNERAIARLDGHCGLVKGVAWDPVDRFLASQSDDKTVRIWRTSDWKTEKVISKPFDLAVYKENSMAFFLRISWSPCGSQLTATNAYKKPGAHYAPMLSRQSGFDDQLDFIGHREPVVTSRFSPRLYRATDAIIQMDKQLEDTVKEKEKEKDKEREKEKKQQQQQPQQNSSATATKQQQQHTDNPPSGNDQRDPYTCLALGSKDCGASIWRATRIRPFFDIADMFDADVIDLSWGTDGYTLMSCSTDGRVMYVRFEPDELGQVVSPEETRTILAKQWRVFGGAGDSVAPIPESATQLEFESDRHRALNSDKPNIEVAKQQQQPTVQPKPKPKPSPVQKPIPESKSPIVVEDSMDIVEDTMDSEAHRSTQKPPIPPQQQRQSPAPASDKRGMLPAPVVAAAAAVRENGPTPPADPRIMAAQAEVRVRGGKRRITPMAVTAVPGENDVAGTGGALAGSRKASMDSDAESVPGTESPWKRARGNQFLTGPDVSRDEASIPGNPYIANGVGPSVGHVVPNGNLRRPKRGFGEMVHPRGIPVPHAADLYAPSVVGLSMMLLPNRGEGPGRCRVISEETPRVILESREQHSSSGGYEVMCSKGGKVQWRDYHPKSAPVTAIAGVGGKFAAVGTGDGMLFLYSAISGRRLAPPISIDSAPYILEALCVSPESTNPSIQNAGQEKWFVVLVSRSALCTVLDVKAKKLVCARSAASLLATPQELPSGGKQESNGVKAKITREVSLCQVTEAGEPILLLSDGHAFVYSTAFCAWLRVADDAAPNSEYVRTIPASRKVGLLRSLQPSVGRARKGLSTLSGMSDLQRSAIESLGHLESLMESAVALRSATDYRYYLTNYASRIAAAVSDDVENCTVRLRELCDQFLDLSNPLKDKTVLGMSCRSLLKDTVLPVIAANRQMQRFVAEYVEILSEVEKKGKSLNVKTSEKANL